MQAYYIKCCAVVLLLQTKFPTHTVALHIIQIQSTLDIVDIDIVETLDIVELLVVTGFLLM